MQPKNDFVFMAAFGFDHCAYYVPMPDARDPRAAWIMKGIENERGISGWWVEARLITRPTATIWRSRRHRTRYSSPVRKGIRRTIR